MADLNDVQSEWREWHSREIESDIDPFKASAKVCAEAGELMDASIKHRETNRRDGKDWEAEERKEMGDVAIALLGAAEARGWSLMDIILERWGIVSQRRFATAGQGEEQPSTVVDLDNLRPIDEDDRDFQQHAASRWDS